ncbi:DNA-directed RNA polymerase subunit alpha C-terminal domain-containing protein [Parabacteroides goldsteinii]
MMSMLTRLRDYAKLLFTREQKLCLVNNAFTAPDATLQEEVLIVSPTPEEQPSVPEQQHVEAQPQPVPPKKYVTEKDVVYESFKKLTPEYLFIITEMRNLLNSENKKFVFHALATHISIKKVAKHLKITQRKVKIIFQEALVDIGSQTGFIRNYLDESEKKDKEIRELKSKVILLNARIKELQNEQVLRMKFAGEKISLKDQQLLLKKPLNVSLDLDTRTNTALNSNHIETLEDLMKYILKNEEMERLKTLHNFGEVSFKRLKSELFKKGIMDVSGHCELLRYVTVSKK